MYVRASRSAYTVLFTSHHMTGLYVLSYRSCALSDSCLIAATTAFLCFFFFFLDDFMIVEAASNVSLSLYLSRLRFLLLSSSLSLLFFFFFIFGDVDDTSFIS